MKPSPLIDDNEQQNDWSDEDELDPEGPPDVLLAWLILQPNRKALSEDVERMRLEVRVAMRMLDLIRYDPKIATGISTRQLMALEAKAKLMALEDTEHPLQL